AGNSGLSTGGGSGGGILLAADSVTVSGSVSAVGAGTSGTWGGVGGNGRVRVLFGATHNVTGTLSGTVTQGLLPPLDLVSSTHPVQTLFYNADFTELDLAWNQSFPSRQGYYWRVDQTRFNPPTPATGTLALGELVSVPRAMVGAGANYFHILPIDAASNVGTVENSFVLQLNTTPPTISSTSHPNQTTWSTNADVFYAWTVPNGDANYRGFYYVLDHEGDTVPTSADTFLPITQKQLLRSGLAGGIWGFHVVSVDQQSYLTKAAGHYQVRIGTDPGNGGVLGQVVDGNGNVQG